jgi:hypothetical protein
LKGGGVFGGRPSGRLQLTVRATILRTWPYGESDDSIRYNKLNAYTRKLILDSI